MNTKFVGAALVAILIIAIGGYFFPLIQTQLGVTGTRFPNGISANSTSPVAGEVRGTSLTITADATIGSTGTAIDQANFGTCHIFPNTGGTAATLAAGATVKYDCQGTRQLQDGPTSASTLTGVQANDVVVLHAPTTTPLTNGGSWPLILGYSASTTAGYIQVVFANTSSSTITFASTTINNWQFWSAR